MRSYWVYSIGLALAWSVVLIVRFAVLGAAAQPVLWVFAGFVLAWLAGTFARYATRPPAKWHADASSLWFAGPVRSFTGLTIGLGALWFVLVGTMLLVYGTRALPALLLLGGFVIGWIGATVARRVYPPPRRFLVHEA